MAFSEKLYDLRKKAGLSQEQLADQLGVSRQAVSKWESDKAFPESGTLIGISVLFDVSLDYLLKDDDTASPAPSETEADSRTTAGAGKNRRILGTVICIAGIVSLIVWGIISVILPSMSDKIGESSAVTLDGNGVFLTLCLAAVICGAVLLLTTKTDK